VRRTVPLSFRFPHADATVQTVQSFRTKAMFYAFQPKSTLDVPTLVKLDIAARSQLLSHTSSATIRLPVANQIVGEDDFGSGS
jgi:hypothetical protein